MEKDQQKTHQSNQDQPKRDEIPISLDVPFNRHGETSAVENNRHQTTSNRERLEKIKAAAAEAKKAKKLSKESTT